MAVVTDVFDTPGDHTWEVPPNVSEATVRVWGPGGPSGGAAPLVGGGGGGGGGACSIKRFTGLTPGSLISLHVGDGGTGGVGHTTTPGAGTGGSNSWFFANDSTGCVAEKGGPGLGGTGAGGGGGQAANGHGDTKFSGGAGIAFNSGNGGHGGGSAGASGHGSNATLPAPGAGGAGGGVTGATRNAGSAGTAGTVPGGGAAGGSATNHAGASGGAGKIEIDWFQQFDVEDEVGITDEASFHIFGNNPTLLLNDALDMKAGDSQITQFFWGNFEVWNWISPYPYQLFAPLQPGIPGRFIVPEGCYEIRTTLMGARGGTGVSKGTGAGGVGGPGGVLITKIAVEPGDLVTYYRGAKGIDGTAEEFTAGGEPGGGGTARNTFDPNYFRDLGGTGGGMSIVLVNNVVVAVAGGGGGGGCASIQGNYNGGDGGAGGGLIGANGQDGTADPSWPAYRGTGGFGGTQSAGGAAGTNTAQNPMSNVFLIPGGFLAGGCPTRINDSFGNSFTYSQSGGGGGGYHGGGPGGLGAGNTLGNLAYGAAGGGGGGSNYAHPDLCSETTHIQGGNLDDDGVVFFVLFARRGVEFAF